ncbi:hypothetical protein GCK32_016334 [Trichostrongylus colubriformis]|uniref:Uncharacterized protein n=1 Tax=Trichostrongylus colubriformis TaxID=6319 RepID=A0AAN8IT69_TRICO
MIKHRYKLPLLRKRTTHFDLLPILVAVLILLWLVLLMEFMSSRRGVFMKAEQRQNTSNSQHRFHEKIVDIAHIFENACKFVWVEDEEPSMEFRIRHRRNHNCEPSAMEIFTRHSDGSFSFRDVAKKTTCVATEIVGGLRNQRDAIESRSAEIAYKHFYVNADVFRINCFDENGVGLMGRTYAGLLNTSIDKLVVEGGPEKRRPIAFNIKNMSISILCFDSTARAQFFRHMRKTVAEMRKMGFITFQAYNKLTTGKTHCKMSRLFV